MRQHPIIVLALLLIVLLIGATAVFAYDTGREDVIAQGVRIGKIDVGGLREDAAEARVRRELLTPLRKPLMVHAGERTFILTAREAHIQANVAAMVDEAVRRSREGSILTRTWRMLTGGVVRARIPARVDYSRKAVQRLVDRVRVASTRKPVEAKINYGTQHLSVRESRTGRTVDAKRLRAQVEAALLDSRGRDRSIRAAIQTVQPSVTTEQMADRHPAILTIERPAYRLRLFKNLKLAKTYPIALGQAGLETPAGLYTIQNKAVNPAWHVPNKPWAGALAGTVVPGGTPQNPLKSRWLGVYDGVGVHGTADRGSIGSNASHGCIRMLVEDVEELYPQVPVGSPIYIQ